MWLFMSMNSRSRSFQIWGTSLLFNLSLNSYVMHIGIQCKFSITQDQHLSQLCAGRRGRQESVYKNKTFTSLLFIFLLIIICWHIHLLSLHSNLSNWILNTSVASWLDLLVYFRTQRAACVLEQYTVKIPKSYITPKKSCKNNRACGTSSSRLMICYWLNNNT